MTNVTLEINGKVHNVDVEPDTPLLWIIREHLGLTGTKYGCGIGRCGACTVLVDGKARRSCQMSAEQAQGKKIVTIEGIPEDHPIKRAWIAEQVPQCGYCQPGQIVQAVALLSENPNPSDADIERSMRGVLCRCGTYQRIKRAIHRAAEGDLPPFKKGVLSSEFTDTEGLSIGLLPTPPGGTLAMSKTKEPWIKISPDGIVTVIISKSEMGQGIVTSLPMIVADELGADWAKVRVEFAPPGDNYRDPILGMQITGGSSSVRDLFSPLRKLAAAARTMLIEVAAQSWGVPEGECFTSDGMIFHKPTGRAISFGQVVPKASTLDVPQDPPLKGDEELALIGKAIPRIDIPDKVNGRTRFGIDSFHDEMLYASVVRPPAYGSKLISYNAEKATGISGVQSVVPISRGIAVCADSIEAAWKGRKALEVEWSDGDWSQWDDDYLNNTLMEHLKSGGVIAENEGSVDEAVPGAHKKVEATYILPYLSHAPLEPMNALAYVKEDRCDVWAPTQAQGPSQIAAAEAAGLKTDQVFIHTTYLGGGFGRRFEIDFVREAVETSKLVGKPIKLIWTREEDFKNDFYRPANATSVLGALDAKGNLIAWDHKIVAPSIYARVRPQEMTSGIDPAAVEGLVNMDYRVPNFKVSYVPFEAPVPVGFWRSVGSSHNAFTVECFVDELAHASDQDPLEFRLKLLEGNSRAQKLLEALAEDCGWDKPLAKGSGRGLAYHFCFGTHVAEVAEVSVDEEKGTVQVHRFFCAVDCGKVVHPDIARAQIEGAVLMGLSAALKEAVSFKDGKVVTSNFDNYDLLRIHEAPEINVRFIESDAPLGGLGEPGVPPVAPAVANAIFDAAKVRVRRLPIRPETILTALKDK
ncbi:MAG: isoquinoline 1-oxidoreductase subunit beta [Synergistales bacterium]|nr:isoquinoline 1-oxidoreductase subunit beta [Synergistales bacterium]